MCRLSLKPKNDVKCSFIIDMRNLNDCSKAPLRKVKLPSIHTVFQTIEREMYRGAPFWGITLDIYNFYWSQGGGRLCGERQHGGVYITPPLFSLAKFLGKSRVFT